ncbi:acyl-CoA dehydrogenase family protein [Candidatus Microthrix parvicella]|uniref:Putative acyl-CoA dehydrogenase n=1 Tax=Candidatus Neomicrothrix parvicella RN1 TaxID=1229780 RepID=R4Z112_9ACTN|nr:acyl-CoA dehydrogenase family protein [Candidatus Microthrix parvicella]CCM64408.1 putative acyl-CoA dehydrogenase [Candidatus Microthrix parvicella RN1]
MNELTKLTNELDPVEQRGLLHAWLADHPSPAARQLADAGLIAPDWPRPWGLGADPHLQLVITEELAAADVAVPDSAIGMGWAGPTILAGGTEAQHRRWLPGILDGTEMWTQLFSEPDAGSDLASLRTTAERDGDQYVVNGQKIWSTWANRSQWGILLARTDPTVAKHQGISYFVVDMATPGVEVRKIIEMTGGNHFNETFLNEVRIPVENRIGAEGDGWRLATVTLGNERVALSEGGVLWGMGPTFGECMDEIRRRPAAGTPANRQRAARVYSDGFVTNLLSQKIVDAMLQGEDPSPFASIRKAKADANAQAILDLICDLAGPAGMLGIQSEEAEATDPWHWAYLFSRALTIGGGTSEIQRNIIGERLLGLPREPRPQP